MSGNARSRRIRLASALAEGSTIVGAARTAGFSESHVRRLWRSDDLLRAEVSRLQAEAGEVITARLAALNTKALDVIDVALGDSQLAPGDYRRARLALGILAEYRARRDAERAGMIERLEADVAELRARIERRTIRSVSS